MEVERLSQFSIKDLILGELLCQANILSDSRLLKVLALAKSRNTTLGSALCSEQLIDQQELFSARRILCNYLKNPDSLEDVLQELVSLHIRYHQIQPSQFSLAAGM